MKRFVKGLLVAGSLLALFGCGGGGGGGVQSVPAGTKTAVVKLSTQGDLPLNAAIAGIGVTIELPAGVTAKVDNAGNVIAATVTPSGVTEAKATVLQPVYEPATTANKGKLSFVITSNETAGFRTGEFATVNLEVASTANPTATDFIAPAEGFKPVNLQGAPITGLSLTHTSEVK